ncbi:MAG TPA: class I adenylate-forming enzyme family protein [Candidatus Saccharimonadales bacterium]|nr:class I adenylate-forming enzyme family protein [Candidatus Saccharimonadales bacterium]
MHFTSHLTDYLYANADNFGTKSAIVTAERTLSWQELARETSSAAAGLSRLVKSDSQQLVGILMSNTWEFVVAYLAILQTGHIAVPIDVIFKELEIEAITRQVPPALIIADKANRRRLPAGAKAVELTDLYKKPSGKEKSIRLDPKKQAAILLFTSGTTGRPKVVPYTHAMNSWNIETCSKVWDWTSDDSQLISLRLSHMYGIVMGLAGSLYHGNTMYLQDRFNEEDTLNLLASGKVTMFPHGPLVFARLLGAAERKRWDLSRVRLFISGSGPLPPAVWQKFKDRFGAEILEVYGSNETGRIASNLLDERIPGSPGRPLPDVSLRFSDEGEVLVKSPGVFPGYWQNEQLTKSQLEPDGYWHTGDLGELADGRVVLKSRLVERIRRQGYSVSPRDVEWALYTNPAIKDVTVVGIQEPGQANDQLVYFMTTDLNEEQIRVFCKTALPSIWRPDKIILLDELPRTRSSKVNIPALKALI